MTSAAATKWLDRLFVSSFLFFFLLFFFFLFLSFFFTASVAAKLPFAAAAATKFCSRISPPSGSNLHRCHSQHKWLHRLFFFSFFFFFFSPPHVSPQNCPFAELKACTLRRQNSAAAAHHHAVVISAAASVAHNSLHKWLDRLFFSFSFFFLFLATLDCLCECIDQALRSARPPSLARSRPQQQCGVGKGWGRGGVRVGGVAGRPAVPGVPVKVAATPGLKSGSVGTTLPARASSGWSHRRTEQHARR